MLNKFIRSYYKILDEKLESGPIIIVIIAILIVSVSIVVGDTNALSQTKTNIFEAKKSNSIVEIDGKQYKMILEEITK